jgi:ectoine hydroxylase-related dioxygenase (phytanoyl-CoA dioxygenase family)
MAFLVLAVTFTTHFPNHLVKASLAHEPPATNGITWLVHGTHKWSHRELASVKNLYLGAALRMGKELKLKTKGRKLVLGDDGTSEL